MRRRLLDHSSHCRIIGGVWALALASLGLGGCQHAQAVKDLEREVVGRPPPVPDTTNPPIDLNAEETDLPDTPWQGAPGVDEENRTSCTQPNESGPAYVPKPEVQDEAQKLVMRMTIDQKVKTLTGIAPPPAPYSADVWHDIQRSEDLPELNLRGYQWRDGPHGVNLEAGQNRQNYNDYSTVFPTTVGQGATFDMKLLRIMGAAMGDDMVASGNMIMMTPCMNILRHPFWGRAQETFGEDTFHLGRAATALTQGLQEWVPGCAKHFAANNIENKRFINNAQMDEQTLREIYGRHFEMVIRDGGVACIMAAYNLVNGEKCTTSPHLLTDMLRDDMRFKGFVITDWWALDGPATGHGPTDPPQDRQTALKALQAGLSVELPWSLNFDAIPYLVDSGDLDQKIVDKQVELVLEQKLRFRSAYLDQPIGLQTPSTPYDTQSLHATEAHLQVAEQVAEESMVLLKNPEGVLPIDPSKVHKVGVIGAAIHYNISSDHPSGHDFNYVTDVALGDRGSSRVKPDPQLVVGPLAGITAAAPVGVTVAGAATATDPAVSDADLFVVMVGVSAAEQGEEYTGAKDRSTLALSPDHDTALNSAIGTNKPVVVIIESGSVVTMPWVDRAKAVIMAWYPGQRGGTAMGRLLFGQANFAGRLPVTWYASEDQLPSPFNEASGDNTTTNMDYFIGYRRLDVQPELGKPLYAFGHGLSYSTFAYERLHIDCADVTQKGLIHVEVDVRNTAGPAGDEVVFVFASYPESTARRSKKELKGFHRFHLEPGKGKRVSIPVRIPDLKYWDTSTGGWVVEQGPVKIQVGPSSDKPLLEQTFTVN